MQILPEYYAHMQRYRDSLLCRFLALYRIKPKRGYLLVMANVLDSCRDINVVCMHVRIYVFMYTYMYMYVCLCMFMYVRKYTCM